ncbi:hypothetical protein ACFPRL_30855 [Pseudoclavibacter helvolus]
MRPSSRGRRPPGSASSRSRRRRRPSGTCGRPHAARTRWQRRLELGIPSPGHPGLSWATRQVGSQAVRGLGLSAGPSRP